MTMLDDRDRRLPDAIDQVGLATRNVLALHPIDRQFVSVDELDERLETLAAADLLKRRTDRNVSGDSVTGYDTDDRLRRRLHRDDGQAE